ncbi:ATP-binding protein [Kitasatospora herbaricolor]|uniref:ATP-binding protein n=1 Tax=Kitasatospora herbaricolor TaxID=68217 RepID=UPI0036D84D12
MSVIYHDRRDSGRLPSTAFSTESAARLGHSTLFRPLPCEVAAVRRHVREVVITCRPPASYPLDTVQLVATELFTNAVKHSAHHGAPLMVVVQERMTTLRVEVHDPDPEMLVAPPRPDLADSGRGLLLVDLLSQEWGVVPGPTGKMVFAEIARPCQ